MGSKTTDMIPLLNNYFCVPVPDDATKFFIAEYDGLNLVWDLPGGRRGFIELLLGQYIFIATDDQITEEQAAEIVGSEIILRDGKEEKVYPHFEDDKIIGYIYGYATDSFRSVLESKGIQGRVAVVKKVK